jgi:hypothetical protein
MILEEGSLNENCGRADEFESGFDRRRQGLHSKSKLVGVADIVARRTNRSRTAQYHKRCKEKNQHESARGKRTQRHV